MDECVNKSCGRRSGDVEGECGEDKRSCEAASAYLLGSHFNQTGDLLETKHYMALVREITVILGDIAFLGVEAKWG